MNEELDEQYLTWLYSQVAGLHLRAKSRTFWSLLGDIHKIEFVWLIPNDDNRYEDGRDLRVEFMNDTDVECDDVHWLNLGCSMLEMLVALSRRYSFEAEGEPRDWFWHMLTNLELSHYTDSYYERWGVRCNREVEEALERVIWRQYLPDGLGGLFPLREPEDDQRYVELWYQLSAYILEQGQI